VETDATFCGQCGRALKSPVKEASSPSVPEYKRNPQYFQPGPVEAPWSGALMLQNGEVIGGDWEADHEIAQMGVVDGRSQTVKVRIKGFLVLTSQRIVFVKQRGVFGKSYHIDMSIPLEGLRGLSMGGLMMKYVSLTDAGGEKVFHVRGIGEPQFPDFRAMIQSQVGSRQKAMEAEKRRERVHIMLDFSFLRDYMSKGGLSLQVVKCPQCGAPMSLPQEGNQVKCTHCGSMIFAQDIMDRVKELIG
jgi:DNA-directed RNA polymerase subunit RPC12/RpoP